MTEFYTLALITLAGLLGGITGLEREKHDKPAGLRTHMLVAASSAAIVLLSDASMQHFIENPNEEFIEADPTRVVHAIVVGIGFIGAGTIVKGQGDTARHLTTASSILFVATVGIAVALELYILSIGMTVLAFVIIALLRQVEKRFFKNSK